MRRALAPFAAGLATGGALAAILIAALGWDAAGIVALALAAILAVALAGVETIVAR